MSSINVSSSPAGTFVPAATQEVYDLSSESDTLALLKSVHRSLLEPEMKNALRDAVFSYRQSFDQSALTNACELFAQVGIRAIACEPTAVKVTTSKNDVLPPQSRLGFARQQPQFATTGVFVSAPQQKEEISTPKTSITPARRFVGFQAKPVDPPKTESIPQVPNLAAPTAEPSPNVPPPVSTAAPKPAPAIPVAETPLVAEPAPIVTVPPVPPSIATAAPKPASVATPKTESSPQVTNLTAPTAEPAPIVTVPPVPPSIATAAPKPASDIPVAETPLTEDATATVVPQPKSPLDRINEIKHDINSRVGNPVNLIDSHNELGREYMSALLDAMKKVNGGQGSELELALAQLESVYTRVLETLNAGASATQNEPTQSVAEPVVEQVVPPVQSASAEPAVQAVSESPVLPISVPIVSVAPPLAPAPSISAKTPKDEIVSVAKTKQVQDLMRSQMIKEVEQAELEKHIAEDKMDPLMVSEVSAGLQQLLSEWVLFKSSGIFGTGPSGIEHPLFKKLASLPMQAVVAGRFEGATPQVRQSISDYMNGWRYEEGLVFDYGETFEHYLRRVIRHIIDKRSKPSDSAKS